MKNKLFITYNRINIIIKNYIDVIIQSFLEENEKFFVDLAVGFQHK